MKINTLYKKAFWALSLLMIFSVSDLLNAQRLPHRSGGGSRMKAPSAGRTMSRPASTPRNRINGGSHVSPSRPSTLQKKPSISNNRPNVSHNNNNRPNINNRPNNNNNNRPNNNHNNRPNNNHNNNHNNFNNHHNNGHHVRPPGRPYHRPPHYYGGWGYYTFHPYYYHPFRPFYWGPIWHPWGYFVASLTTTAIIIAVNNERYHYDQGVYYTESNGGYTVVEAPIGATIKVLPNGYETVKVNETTNNYYYGGTYYEKSSGGYTVVEPTAGTVVEHLPEGAEEVRMGDQTYVKYGDTYYQPVKVDGKNMYEIAEAKEE